MFDDKTANFAIPLPHQQNTLAEDVHRLRAALTAIDASLQSLEARLQRRGAANGLASLDANGRLPAAELTVHQHAMAELSDLATWKADAVDAPLAARELTANRGQPHGYAPLDDQGFLPMEHIPESLLGTVRYMGSWNASTNTPAIGAASSSNAGHYYIVSVAGSTTINGESGWVVGDWIISNGSSWARIANAEVFDASAVRSGVFHADRIPVLPVAKVDGLQSSLNSKQAALGFTPVRQSSANLVHLGWMSDLGMQLKVDTTDLGSMFHNLDHVPVRGRNLNLITTPGVYRYEYGVAPNTNAPDPNNVKYGVMLVFRVGDIVAQVVMSMGLAQGNLYLRCWVVGNTPPAWSKLTPSP